MIFIKRDRLDERGVPIRPSAKWFDAAEDASKRAVQEGKDHRVRDVYRDPEVKAALEKLFHRKCAYCEQPLGEDWDVDHFRPKKSVAESAGHPGYYWLAYRWENLYPACRFCNQRRREALRWPDEASLPAAGKLDQFPLEDEAARATSPQESLAAEAPLLLDPCQKTDAFDGRFLFNVEGEISAVDENDRRAKETIKICNLNRVRLCEERVLAIQIVAKVLMITLLAREDEDQAAAMLSQNLLADLIADKGRFAAAVRNVVRDPHAFGVRCD